MLQAPLSVTATLLQHGRPPLPEVDGPSVGGINLLCHPEPLDCAASQRAKDKLRRAAPESKDEGPSTARYSCVAPDSGPSPADKRALSAGSRSISDVLERNVVNLFADDIVGVDWPKVVKVEY